MWNQKGGLARFGTCFAILAVVACGSDDEDPSYVIPSGCETDTTANICTTDNGVPAGYTTLIKCVDSAVMESEACRSGGTWAEGSSGGAGGGTDEAGTYWCCQ